ETWHCIEDAGVNPKQLSEQTTGVYVGVMANDYGQEAAHPERTVDPYAGLGNYANVLSNRLSYFLGTHGPSSTINAACASSLVAIHEAKRALQSGECRYALAAGVNLNLTPWKHISFGRSRMLSPDGQCKTFDAEANGYVPGDGVAVVLMQSLSEALAGGNPIYGVVRASGINHNGLNASITAPNVEAQQRLIESCYREAGFSPETVGYIEAHGTGTSLGDPIEVEALTRAFSGYTDKQGFCHIGSVKSNIGHLEGAAGIAGVIKVLLMMRHRRIPRTLNIKTLNPIINFEQSPFIPAMEPVEWESSDQAPLRAGVSSFGFGGVNSHLLLEEAPQQRDTAHGPRTEEIGGFPFMLSAVTPDALRQLHAKWCQWEEVVSHPQPQELCATLACGRAGLPLRYSAWLEQWSDPESALSGEPPTEKTVSHERWELLLGDLRWRGWGELSDSLQQQISAHLLSPSHVIDENEGSEPGRCMALLQSESWSENCIPLYSFMVGHAALQGIEQAGFLPERVSCAKGGGWLALVRSGVVEVNDALAVLAGKREIESLSLKRPQLDFMNPVGQELEPPLRLSVSYLKGVFESALADVEREHLKFHFDKAKQLYKNQYTFKRHLHEWDEVLQEPLGRSTEQLLEDERVIDDPSLRLLLMTIVISSLRMLNRKWNLADLAEVGDEAFRELNDLLLDEVLERKQVVELLLDKSTDLDAVVEGMSRRHGHLDQSRPYAALRAQSSVFDGIDNLKTWLAEMPESQAATPERMGRLVIGAAKERDTDIATGFEKGIAPVLLLLWQQGVDIDWSVIYPPGSFQKQSIPRYPFTTRRFWLEAVNHLEPQSATTLPTPQSKSINQQSVTDGGVLGQLIQILATQLDMDESDLDGFTSLQEYGLDDRVVATEFCGI
ncbi:MAG: polyketide synthase, partial [Gammaproteobacteria bacterium]|nr:polyketide synthase [Gammaproteobacteria bacterium]